MPMRMILPITYVVKSIQTYATIKAITSDAIVMRNFQGEEYRYPLQFDATQKPNPKAPQIEPLLV